MKNLDDYKKLEEWVLALGNGNGSYEQCLITNLNALVSSSLNMAKSLAIIADRLDRKIILLHLSDSNDEVVMVNTNKIIAISGCEYTQNGAANSTVCLDGASFSVKESVQQILEKITKEENKNENE